MKYYDEYEMKNIWERMAKIKQRRKNTSCSENVKICSKHWSIHIISDVSVL